MSYLLAVANPGLWPNLIEQLNIKLQQAIQDGNYALPLLAIAAPKPGVDFSLRINQNGSIKVEANGELLQSMIPLAVTVIVAGQAPETLMIG